MQHVDCTRIAAQILNYTPVGRAAGRDRVDSAHLGDGRNTEMSPRRHLRVFYRRLSCMLWNQPASVLRACENSEHGVYDGAQCNRQGMEHIKAGKRTTLVTVK